MAKKRRGTVLRLEKPSGGKPTMRLFFVVMVGLLIFAGYVMYEGLVNRFAAPGTGSQEGTEGDRFTNKMAGMAISNPASEYCESIGGIVSVTDTPQGQSGTCRMRDGRVCDEWRLFLTDGVECVLL